MKLVFIVEYLSAVRWCIYASYNTHKNFSGHTGFMVSTVRGDVLNPSLKQKFTVKFSTEGEVVGIHSDISVVLCSKHFIESQGYKAEHNKLYQ